MKTHPYLFSSAAIAGGLICSALMAAPASAQTATSDRLIVRSATGAIVRQVVIPEGTTERNTFHKVRNVKIDTTQFGSFTAFVEPVAGVAKISDYVGIHKSTTGVLMFGFSSDTEMRQPSQTGWAIPGVAGTFMSEPPQPIDVTRYLDRSASSGQAGWTATFQSDVEVTGAPAAVPVPEPGAWAMLLVGFGGLGAAMRGARRRETARA